MCVGVDLTRLHSCLNRCVDLWSLDLSDNLLSASCLSLLEPDKLRKLKYLNLSRQRGPGGAGGGGRGAVLDTFPMAFTTDMNGGTNNGVFLVLQSLHLEGNNFSTLDQLRTVARCMPNLGQLWLRDPYSAAAAADPSSSSLYTNPICSTLNPTTYKQDIQKLFPNLRVLDGERLPLPLGGQKGGSSSANDPATFYTMYEQLEKETSQWAKDKEQENKSQELINANQQQVANKIEDWLPQGQSLCGQSRLLSPSSPPRLVWDADACNVSR